MTVAPPEAARFLPVHDAYGLRLALVFGNHAPGGQCPYYTAGRCHHCDIGAGEGREFTLSDNRARLAWFQQHYAEALPRVAHLVLYNSGSTLNPRELPVLMLDEILDWAASLPCLKVLSLDSREAFLSQKRLADCARRLGHTLRPILGLESARESVRNLALDKHMSDSGIRRAFRAVALARAEGADCQLDCNLVVAGPGTTGDGVADALETAEFAFDLAGEVGLTVDLNLHPYYPSARGRLRFPEHGRCSLPVAIRAVEGIANLARARSRGSHLFIGWQDEGHDQDQGVRAVELQIIQERFDRFNRTQDAAVLRG